MTKSDRRIRIISGEFGGQRISTPKGIRPTTERVREAIFSAQGDIGGLSVLDLYTGSGAFGLEAISRGWPRRSWSSTIEMSRPLVAKT